MTDAFFSDLDATLLFSKRWVKTYKQSVGREVLLAEHASNGHKGFWTERSVNDLRQLSTSGIKLIPTTTRSQKQFERLNWYGIPVDQAIVLNGARVLLDGKEDEAWKEHIQRTTLTAAAEVEEMLQVLKNFLIEAEIPYEAHTAEELFIYFIMPHSEAFPLSLLPELKDLLHPYNWVHSLQGKKLYALPRGLTKEAAAKYLKVAYGYETVYAAGDSRLDAGLLEMSDYSWSPRHGELCQLEVLPKDTILIRAYGLLASDVITGDITALRTADK